MSSLREEIEIKERASSNSTPQKTWKQVLRPNTCTCMFIAAIFTKAKRWKQPKFPSMVEWASCDISTQQNIIQP